MQIISAEKIFTGYEWLEEHAIVVENSNIERVVPISEISTGDHKHFPGCFIVPAFIDAQVYGAAKNY